MIDVYIQRLGSSDHGTFGVLFAPAIGFSCYTGEPPWRNNLRSLSCIPPGDYIVKVRNSPKYGLIFHVKDVKGRTYILIHSGNFAGNIEKGLRTHTQGCILLGQKTGWLAGQKCVLNSRVTVKKFMSLMQMKPFKLKIR